LTTLTVALARRAGVFKDVAPGIPGRIFYADQLTPTLTLYQGWGDETAVLEHEANPFNLTSITKTFSLVASRYSLSFNGSTPESPANGVPCIGQALGGLCDYSRHGYSATLSTTSPVPLPTAAWLFGSGVAGLTDGLGDSRPYKRLAYN
jgi:hypothetical protein